MTTAKDHHIGVKCHTAQGIEIIKDPPFCNLKLVLSKNSILKIKSLAKKNLHSAFIAIYSDGFNNKNWVSFNISGLSPNTLFEFYETFTKSEVLNYEKLFPENKFKRKSMNKS